MNETTPTLIDIDALSMKLNIPKGTLYNWVYLRRIPFIKAGRCLRFDPQEVLTPATCATTSSPRRGACGSDSGNQTTSVLPPYSLNKAFNPCAVVLKWNRLARGRRSFYGTLPTRPDLVCRLLRQR